MNWISTLKKLPEENVTVIAYCPKGNLGSSFQCYAYRVDMTWYDDNDQRTIDTPMPISHWMPKPKDPTP